MPRSDTEYVEQISSDDDFSDDHDLDDPAPSRRDAASSSSRPRQRRNLVRRAPAEKGKSRALLSWEGGRQYALDLGDAAHPDRSHQDLARVLEAKKRARIRQEVHPFQRGIIRHLVLVLDMSEAMLEKDMDMRPNRYLVTIRIVKEYVSDFFEQNPISQISILGMYDGKCIKISDMSGNPTDHILALDALRSDGGSSGRVGTTQILEPKGAPSLQNALEMSRAMLYHTPKHGTREVIILLGALLSNDPGDIHDTITNCIRDKLKVSIIGMLARLKVCADIVSRTNDSEESGYWVAIDRTHFRELLKSTTTPPVVHSTEEDANVANLLVMGFPSRMEEDAPSMCACHGNLIRGGYTCPRCATKVCSLPQTCPACGLTLILSTHLARSYHHLFPLRSWIEVSWQRAREMGSVQCKGCLSPFVPVKNQQNESDESDQSDGDENVDGVTTGVGRLGMETRKSRLEGSSESARYECPSCHHHYCVDCDVFCHQTLFNCPGCQSGPPAVPVGQSLNGKENDPDDMDTDA
jgi:transcription initiation factor TFIIH subunit 2